jgi:hypothetical protein
LENNNGIRVKGKSMEPIAREGQLALINEGAGSGQVIHPGALAVVETNDERIGNVIKRVFTGLDNWVMVSPNPVDAIPPIVVATERVKKSWLVNGVLFETEKVIAEDGSNG